MEILPLSSGKVLSRITSTDSEEITTIIFGRPARKKYLFGYGQNMAVDCFGIPPVLSGVAFKGKAGETG